MLLASAILLTSTLIVSYRFQMIGNITAGPEDPLEAWSELSYIVWKYNSTHYAVRNMSTLLVDFLGTNATAIITSAIDNAENKSIFLKDGYYDLDSSIIITHSIAIYGEHSSNTLPSVQADYIPSHLYGTVLRTSQNIDVLVFSGSVFNVVVKNIGIEFTGASTGSGLKVYNPNSPSADSYAITYGIFEDIAVLNNDGDSYAFYFENTVHIEGTLLRSWGGLFFYYGTNDYDCQYGNAVFNELYCYVTKVCSNNIFFVNAITSDGSSLNVTGLMQFNRVQINAGTEVVTDPYAALFLNRTHDTTFIALDIECPVEYVIIIKSQSRSITFINPYLWSTHADSIIYADVDCKAITFIEGWYDIKKIQLASYPNAMINPHWTVGYMPTFYIYTTWLLIENYTIATQSCAYDHTALSGTTSTWVAFAIAGVSFNQPDNHYGVLVTPHWNTDECWVDNKTTTGFTFHYTVTGSDETFDWFVFRRPW